MCRYLACLQATVWKQYSVTDVWNNPECLDCFDMLASIDPTLLKEKKKNEKRTTLITPIERTWYSEFNYFRRKYISALDLGKRNICYIRQKKVIRFSVEQEVRVCCGVTAVTCTLKIISWRTNEWLSVPVTDACFFQLCWHPTIGRNIRIINHVSKIEQKSLI